LTVKAATSHHQPLSLDKQNISIQVGAGLARDHKSPGKKKAQEQPEPFRLT